MFTGEWSGDVEITETIEVPAEIANEMIGVTGEKLAQLEALTHLSVNIEPGLDGEGCTLIVGPGFPPDVKVAIDNLNERVRTLKDKYYDSHQEAEDHPVPVENWQE